MAAFHEALRLALEEGISNRAAKYSKFEKALSGAFRAMGCDVTSDMTSLVVLNLPKTLWTRDGVRSALSITKFWYLANTF